MHVPCSPFLAHRACDAKFQSIILVWFFVAVGGNIVNIVLDPILMFLCGLGISGAAGATVIAQ